MRGALADRLVVVVRLLLGAVGVERRGRVICGCVRSVNRRVREELRGRAEVLGKVV
jgi:hypothetical protein